IQSYMNQYLFFLFLLGFILTGCSKSNIPACISKKITAFEKEACSQGAQVEQYLFQSKTVFVFQPGNCGADMAAHVVDSNCADLGFLGGIMGNTKINGEEFSQAKLIKTTWKKK
ncbi:MAG: hypothetical protein KA797_07200, partial [Chitinophagales bacterium]|nr:hypothetical protein [Chitinophagales bacterium]